MPSGPLLRASSLPLLLKCSGSAYLPTLDTKSENAIKGAEWGTMVHRWKETGEIHGPDKRTESAFTRAIELSGIDRAILWPAGGTHEQAVAIRVDGNRQSLGRKPAEADAVGWVTGTDDFQWFLFDGELWIDDLKTGKYYEDRDGNQIFAQDVRSAQLRFYALAISTLLQYSGVVHVSLTHWPRLPVARRHSAPERLWTSYTTDELGVLWGQLETLFSEASAGVSGDYTLNPGDHCRFCPSKTFCLVAQPDPPPQWRTYVQSE